MLKEWDQYGDELAKLKKMSSENSKSQAEHITKLVAGLSSMNIGQEKLQEELRKVKLEKGMEKKEFKKLIQKVQQSSGFDSSDEDDGHNHPESRHRLSIRKRRANGNRDADRQPMDSTELPGYTYATAETPVATRRVSEIHCPLL